MVKRKPQEEESNQDYSDNDDLSDMSNESDEETTDDDLAEVASFVAGDQEEAGVNPVNYREIDQRLDERDKEERQRENRMPQYEEEEDNGQLLAVDVHDPGVYRVPVHRGKAAMCVVAMTQYIMKRNWKVDNKQALHETRLNISSVSCSDKDMESVRIESTDPIHVEQLAGNPLFKSYVNPFKRQFMPQPHTKRQQLLKNITQFDMKDDQPRMFDIQYDSEVDYQLGAFLLLRQQKSRGLIGPTPCRLYQLDRKRGRATVLLLTPYRSLQSTEQTIPHRITLEEYQESGVEDGQYQVEKLFPSGMYYQGLLMLDVNLERLRKPRPGEQIDRQLLALSGDHATALDAQQNQELRPLRPGDRVMLNESYHNSSLRYAKADVIRALTDYEYLLRLVEVQDLGKEAGSQQFQIGSEVTAERFQLIKFLKESQDVCVCAGKYKGLTGKIKNFVVQGNRIVVELKAHVLNEFYDRSCGIVTDDCDVSDQKCNSLSEARWEEKVFRVYNQLVKTPTGDIGIIDFLLHKSARVLTTDDQSAIYPLSELQPVYAPKGVPITQDGQSPPISVSFMSEVKVEGSQDFGKVLQIATIASGAILFIQILSGSRVGMAAVPAKKTKCVNSGPVVEKNRRSQNQLLQNARVRVSDSRYMGREGVFISETGTEGKVRIRLADQIITVEKRWVTLIQSEADAAGARDYRGSQWQPRDPDAPPLNHMMNNQDDDWNQPQQYQPEEPVNRQPAEENEDDQDQRLQDQNW